MTRLARCLLATACLVTALARAEVVDVRQGTNLSVAYDPVSETIVLDLLGGLWRMPAAGGGATLLIPAGSGISQPRIDNTAARIVFQRWTGGQWDLWLLDSRTGSWTPLTETPYNEREPDFSADGRRIVFSSDRTGRYCLWELDLENGALRQLTDEPGDNHFPTVAADGEIVYVNRRAKASSLRLFSGGPAGMEMLHGETTFDAPSWRPGGSVVVFNDRVEGRRSDLKLLIEADEPVLTGLTEQEDVFVGRVAWLSAAEYLYAADGQLWRRGIASHERKPVHLFAGASIDLAEPRPVRTRLDAPGPHPVRGAAGFDASASDQRLAFAALGDLWVAERRRVSRLTDDEYLDIQPRFAADGESIVFVSDRGGGMDLWQLDLDHGEPPQPLTREGGAFEPVVSPDGRSVAYLSLAGAGPWDRASIRRVWLDRALHSETVTENLYDASGLSWRGGNIHVSARAGAADAELAEIVLKVPATTGDPESGAAPDAERRRVPEDPMLTWTPAAADAPYVVQAGRLFDGIGNDYARHVDIHVEGQRIVAIVGRGRLPLPEHVIDAQDLTVIPGLIDVHAHHSAAAGGRLGRQWLRYGVTTVREVDAELDAAIERAESWASGKRLGPRLVIVPRNAVGPGVLDANSPVVVQSGAAVSRGFAHAAAGQWLRSGEPVASLPTLLRAPEAAAADLELSPLNLSYQDTLGSLLASGKFVATGIAATRGLASADARAPEQPALTRALGDTLARLMRSSGRIAIASEAPAVPYGSGFHEELAALADAHLPTAQILRWATAGGAMALGLDQQLGTLEAGKLADFVVIDGDPLARIGDARRIEAVVRGGVWLEREDLVAD